MMLGQWLWLSWQSGCFRFQRSAVRIQTPANFYRTFIIYCQLYCIEKTKIKEKEAGNGPFFKDCNDVCLKRQKVNDKRGRGWSIFIKKSYSVCKIGCLLILNPVCQVFKFVLSNLPIQLMSKACSESCSKDRVQSLR